MFHPSPASPAPSNGRLALRALSPEDRRARPSAQCAQLLDFMLGGRYAKPPGVYGSSLPEPGETSIILKLLRSRFKARVGRVGKLEGLETGGS
jgi:hypothetical protein